MNTVVYGIQEIREANKVAGQHYFDKDTMRFFRSRVAKVTHSGPGGIFFVTSEQFDATSPRLFTVRSFDTATGHCDTAPGCEFQEYKTGDGAHRRAKKLAEAIG